MGTEALGVVNEGLGMVMEFLGCGMNGEENCEWCLQWTSVKCLLGVQRVVLLIREGKVKNLVM